jgi:proline-specific peptidase
VLDRGPGSCRLVLSSSPPSVSRWVADAARLRAALPAGVRAVLDRHDAEGHFCWPEYQCAVAEFYRRHLCRLDPWPDCLERTLAAMGTDVCLSMWGPSEFGPVTGTLRDWNVTARLGEIAVPTLITGGRFDEATPEHVAVLARGVSGAELVIFENSSHTAFLEERAGYLQCLRGFFARAEAGGNPAAGGSSG